MVIVILSAFQMCLNQDLPSCFAMIPLCRLVPKPIVLYINCQRKIICQLFKSSFQVHANIVLSPRHCLPCTATFYINKGQKCRYFSILWALVLKFILTEIFSILCFISWVRQSLLMWIHNQIWQQQTNLATIPGGQSPVCFT